MGAHGTQTREVEQSARAKRLNDIAAYICAEMIAHHLSNMEVEQSRVIAALQQDYELSAVDAEAVVKEMKAIRRKIDPYGDWKG